jgi:D-arabinose 1-dehydrogenase-like Zn-dependent alcohol dehydrogenase
MWRVEMKALSVDQNGKLEVCDVPKPVYGDCQALVKTLSCGVCNGTDMKLIHGSFKNMTHYPMLLGHEAVGQVVEKGKYVTSFEIGDIVLLPFLYEESRDEIIQRIHLALEINWGRSYKEKL